MIVGEKLANVKQSAPHRLQLPDRNVQCRRWLSKQFKILKILKTRCFHHLVKHGAAAAEHMQTLACDLTRSAAVPANLHSLAQFVTRANNGRALVLQQITKPAHYRHLVAWVVASITGVFQRIKPAELLLRAAQSVWFDAAQPADVTNREVTLNCHNKKQLLQRISTQNNNSNNNSNGPTQPRRLELENSLTVDVHELLRKCTTRVHRAADDGRFICQTVQQLACIA